MNYFIDPIVENEEKQREDQPQWNQRSEETSDLKDVDHVGCYGLHFEVGVFPVEIRFELG